MYKLCSHHAARLLTAVLLTTLFCLGQTQFGCLAANHPAQSHHLWHNQSYSTLLYGIYDNTGEANNKTYAQLIADENKPNISIFRLRRDGSLVPIPMRYNSKAFSNGYSGRVNSLTASPDGRFLIAECQNTHEDNYAPIFVQYRILPDGQLKPYDRFGLLPGGRNLVFHPSGRYVYLSCPDQSSSQSQPGTIAEFHVTPAGDILYPPFATVSCGPMPTALALDNQGRVGAVVDAETGFLWQYTLTPQGRLVPANPPSISVGRNTDAALMVGSGQSLYIPSQQSRERYRMYQLRRNNGGGFSLLMPWAMRLPGVIWSVVVSSKRRLMYVSSGGKLLLFHISPQGALQQSRYSLSTKVGLNLAIDEATGYLYVLGLYKFFHVYRIGQDGKLKAVGKHPAHVNLRLNDLTIVHR